MNITEEEIEKASKAFAEGATFDPTMKGVIAEIFDKGVRWALSQPQWIDVKEENEMLKKFISSESVYSLLRYGVKHPSSSGVDELDDSYMDLYNISIDERKKLKPLPEGPQS